MLLMDLHQVGVELFTIASVASLMFVVAKALAKEFETVAVAWIRTFRRIQDERQKSTNRIPPLQRAPVLDDTRWSIEE
jgi:hypothetical protein